MIDGVVHPWRSSQAEGQGGEYVVWKWQRTYMMLKTEAGQMQVSEERGDKVGGRKLKESYHTGLWTREGPGAYSRCHQLACYSDAHA